MGKSSPGQAPTTDKGTALSSLLRVLDSSRPVVVQTHDYPDIDAVASAWSLARLLERRGFRAQTGYRGEIRSRSLSRLVDELGVGLRSSLPELNDSQILVVDGSPTNGNVSLLPGELCGVIDHHCRSVDPSAPFLDLRPELAACSTIIAGYWLESRAQIPRDLATALLAGIQSDTDFLSRRASPEDFAVYAALFTAGDFELASRIVRTVLDLGELKLISGALEHATIRDGLLWAWIPGPCGQEALAVLAEFVLRVEELKAAVVVEQDRTTSEGSGVHLSVRSKDPAFSAFDLVRMVLVGMGTGGGHSHSAGGFIPDSAFPGEEELRDRFFAAAREILH